jgi:hypothetical protein
MQNERKLKTKQITIFNEMEKIKREGIRNEKGI